MTKGTPSYPEAWYEAHFERDRITSKIVRLRFGDQVYAAGNNHLGPSGLENRLHEPIVGFVDKMPVNSDVTSNQATVRKANGYEGLRHLKDALLNGHTDDGLEIIAAGDVDVYRVTVPRDKLNPGESAYATVVYKGGEPVMVEISGANPEVLPRTPKHFPKSNGKKHKIPTGGIVYLIPAGENYIHIPKGNKPKQ